MSKWSQFLADKSLGIMLAIASISAGWIHLNFSNPPRFQASPNFGPPVAAGLFFLALAIFQFVWAVIVLVAVKNRLLMKIGILGNLVSILIYFVSVVTPLPFGVPQQRILGFAMACKSVEAIFVVGALSTLVSK